MYVYIYVCMHACMYVPMYAYMHTCMYFCIKYKFFSKYNNVLYGSSPNIDLKFKIKVNKYVSILTGYYLLDNSLCEISSKRVNIIRVKN